MHQREAHADGAAVDAAPPVADGEPAARRASEEVGPRRPALSRVAPLLALLLYAFLGAMRLWPVWGSPNTVAQCGCGDGAFSMWFLGWWPFAAGHGVDPFHSDWLNVPHGFSVLWNVSYPLPALVMAPVTVLVGTVAAYNLLVALAFALSAFTAYLTIRRWVAWQPAAVAGGLLFGFSPYMIGQGLGHLHMILVPLVPLTLAALDEVLVRQRPRPLVAGALLGVVVAAQFLTSVEVFASMAVVGAVGLAVLVLLFPHAVRARLGYAVRALAVGVVTALVLLAWPLAVMLFGADRTTASMDTSRFAVDLLGWVTPTQLVRFAPDAALRVSSKFTGNVAENGFYLGIPLVLTLCAVVLVGWRRPVVRFMGVLLAAVMVLAMGPHLHLAGRVTTVPLPGAVVAKAPLIGNIIPTRLTLYVFLFAALLLAIAADRLHAAVGARRRPATAGLLASALAIVALLPLVPGTWHYAVGDVAIPAWFRSGDVKKLAAGSTAMVLPMPGRTDSRPMLWQAAAHYRFKSPGGYVLVPDAQGRGTFGGTGSRTSNLFTWIGDGRLGALRPADVCTMHKDMRRWRVRTVVLVDDGRAATAKKLSALERVLGRGPVREHDAWVWHDVTDAELSLAGCPGTG